MRTEICMDCGAVVANLDNHKEFHLTLKDEILEDSKESDTNVNDLILIALTNQSNAIRKQSGILRKHSNLLDKHTEILERILLKIEAIENKLENK